MKSLGPARAYWCKDVRQRLPLHDAAMNAHRDLCRWLIRQDPSNGSCAQKDAEGQVPVHAVCTRQWLQKHSEADHLAFLDMILPLNQSAAQLSFDYADGAKQELEQCKAEYRSLLSTPSINQPTNQAIKQSSNQILWRQLMLHIPAIES